MIDLCCREIPDINPTTMETPFSVRKLVRSDAEQFSGMRLLSLQTDPDAFVATIQEERMMSSDDVQNYLIKNYALGAFDDHETLIGTLVYMEQERQKFKHIGILGGMYVHPSFRGRGIGKKLLTAMLENLQMTDHLYALQLKVVSTNSPAIRLYESLGFSVWATEKNALLHEGKFFDQHHMMLSF